MTLHPCNVVVAAHPDVVLAVAEDHRGAVDFLGVNGVPLYTVVVEQSLEVGDEYRTVLAYLYVVVAVVPVVFGRRIVANQGKTLRPNKGRGNSEK